VVAFQSVGGIAEGIFAALANFVNGLFQVSICFVANEPGFAVFFAFAVGCAQQVAHAGRNIGGPIEQLQVEVNGCQQFGIRPAQNREIVQVLYHVGVGIALRNLVNLCLQASVFPESKSLVITPIAPHNLNVRSIIVPDDNIVSFEVEGRAENFMCAMDARREVVNIKTQVAVRKESFTMGLVRLSENTFLETLRKKLAWGLDIRN